MDTLLDNTETDNGDYLTKCSKERIEYDNPHFEPYYLIIPFTSRIVKKPISELSIINNFYENYYTAERGYVYPWLKIDKSDYLDLMNNWERDFNEYSDNYSHEKLIENEKYELKNNKWEDESQIKEKYKCHWKSIRDAKLFFENYNLSKLNIEHIWVQEYIGNGDRMFSRIDIIMIDEKEVIIYRLLFIDLGYYDITDLFTKYNKSNMIPTCEWKERIKNNKSAYVFTVKNCMVSMEPEPFNSNNV